MTDGSGPLEMARQTLVDDAPMVAFRNEAWCCLLCKRQFKSEEQLSKHITKSNLHSENLAAAAAARRVRQPQKHAREEEAEEAPPAKRAAGVEAEASSSGAEGGAGGGGGVGGGLSALEQMALFEKRLKSQARRMPEKEVVPEDSVKVDSNKARTINNQMDWECSGCGQFNFARSITCISCKQHVDSTTKYLSNRLKEIKQERFAAVFGAAAGPGVLSGRAAASSRDPAADHAFEQSAIKSDNIGHQMLAGMGWKGGGLGSGSGGITEPVRARGEGASGSRASFHQ